MVPAGEYVPVVSCVILSIALDPCKKPKMKKTDNLERIWCFRDIFRLQTLTGVLLFVHRSASRRRRAGQTQDARERSPIIQTRLRGSLVVNQSGLHEIREQARGFSYQAFQFLPADVHAIVPAG